MIDVAEPTVSEPELTVSCPNITLAPATKFVPVIVTGGKYPVLGPVAGLTLETVGGAS